jgi:hypothetical protein
MSTMPDRVEAYVLSLKGAGVDICVEIDQVRAGHVMAVAFGSVDPRYVARGAHSTEAGDRQGEDAIAAERPAARRLSLREFLESSGAKRSAERILAVGHFFSEQEGKEQFGLGEVRQGFQAAREEMPSNLPRDLQMVAKKGWIAEVPGSRGQFYVTRKGEEALRSRFGQE